MREKVKHFLSSGLLNKSVKVLMLRILGVLLFFSLTLFLTNFYDPKHVGEYDFIRSFLMFTGALVVLGMQQSVLYFSGVLLSKNKIEEIKKVYLKMIVILALATISVITIFLLFLINYVDAFFNKNVSDTIFKALLALIFYGLTMLNTDMLRAIHRLYFSEVLRNILRYLFFFIGIIILFFIDKYELLVDVFLINFLILGTLSTVVIFYYLSIYKNSKETVSPISYKDIIKISLPMAISSIAFLLMQSVDLLLIGKFLSFEQVAYYAVTVKLTMIISLVLSSVNSVIAPKVSELYNSKLRHHLQGYIKQATRIIFLLTIPAILLLSLFSEFILNFFGEQYLGAKYALLILLVGQAVNALCGSVGIYMNMTGKQNILQKILLLALLLNIALNWVLIPKFGINGAAIATSISMVFWNMTGVVFLYQKDKIKTYIH